MDKQLHLKEKIKEQYGKIALDGNSNSCCVPSSDCCGTSSEILISSLNHQKLLDMMLTN
jgi:arsenite methyltransferase